MFGVKRIKQYRDSPKNSYERVLLLTGEDSTENDCAKANDDSQESKVSVRVARLYTPVKARIGMAVQATTAAISPLDGVLAVGSFMTWSLGIALGHKDLAAPVDDSITNIGISIILIYDFPALLFAFGNAVGV